MREDTEGMNKGGEVKGGNMEREREKDIRERNEVEGREAMWSMREREREEHENSGTWENEEART